jgi:hypothetical protein
MFAGGTRVLLEPLHPPKRWLDEVFLKRLFVVVVVTLLPIVLYLLVGNPVSLLKIAGFIEAAHIPVLVLLVLVLNHTDLPRELRPSLFTTVCTALAGVFFAVFSVIYVLQLTGVIKL